MNNADTLPVSQQSLIKIIDAACILRQQCLEEVVRVIGSDLWPDQAQTDYPLAKYFITATTYPASFL